LRLYESFGGHANNVSVNVSPVIAQHVESVSRCNLLEEEGPQQGALTWDKERGVISGLCFGPYLLSCALANKCYQTSLIFQSSVSVPHKNTRSLCSHSLIVCVYFHTTTTTTPTPFSLSTV